MKGLGMAVWPALGVVSAVLGLLLVLGTALNGCGNGDTGNGNGATTGEISGATTATTPAAPTTAAPRSFTFGTPTKSAHYESNTPAHGALLPAPPINVVIDFNFDLAPPSTISVTSGGREYGTGETLIDEGKLAMRRTVDPQAPDGLYDVQYRACWPDGSCHDGSFQFAVDRALTVSYTDMTGSTEVAVEMRGISFVPANMIISRGTKVTWTNRDEVEHFVNTDSHPAHTYFPEMNSRGLATGAFFSATFIQPGAYPYHCSAHAAQMSGMIVVR